MSRTKQLLSKGCKIPQSIPKIWDFIPYPSEHPGGAQAPGTRFCTQKSLIQEQIILKTSDTWQEDEPPVLCGKLRGSCGAGTTPRFTGFLWNVLDGSEQPLHRCLIPQQDFWDTPALLIPRILSSEEETIPESVGAVREPSAGVELPGRLWLRCPNLQLGVPWLQNSSRESQMYLLYIIVNSGNAERVGCGRGGVSSGWVSLFFRERVGTGMCVQHS